MTLIFRLTLSSLLRLVKVPRWRKPGEPVQAVDVAELRDPDRQDPRP